MFSGSLKIFINEQDQGYVLENENKLTEEELYATIDSSYDGVGKVRFVE